MPVHTHTHTRARARARTYILIPFEDHEPTGLKVDRRLVIQANGLENAVPFVPLLVVCLKQRVRFARPGNFT